MLSNLLEKLLKIFKYVRTLERQRDNLQQQIDSCDMRIQRINKALAEERKEKEMAMSIIKMIIDRPIMVFGNKEDEKYIILSRADLEKYKEVNIEIFSTCPQDAVKILIKK